MIPTFEDKVRWGLPLPFFFAAALLQAAQSPSPSLFGARADLVLVAVTSWAVVRSHEEAMVAGPPAALLAGLLGSGPIGTPLLTLLAPIALAVILRSGNANPRLPSLCMAMAISSVAAILAELTVQFLGGERGFHLAGLGTMLVGAALVNTLLAAALYWPLSMGRRRKLVRRTGLSLS